MWNRLRSRLIELVHRATGNYKVWVIHTVEEVGIHRWQLWKEIMPMITSLLSISTEKAHIRSFQAYNDGKGWLGFGRMPWNEESNRKWTTKYIEAPAEKMGFQFYDTQIWAPDWNSCLKRNVEPDVFVKVHNSQGDERLAEALVIAIPVHLFHKHEGLIRSELEKIRSTIPGAGISSIVRKWNGVQYNFPIEYLPTKEMVKIMGTRTRS